MALDIGDHRVMAGVHDPSDNLGTWVVLMGLANHVYGSTEIKAKLWQAITDERLVYRLIRESGAAAYCSHLDLLDRMKESE